MAPIYLKAPCLWLVDNNPVYNGNERGPGMTRLVQLKRQGEPPDAAARDRDTQRRGVGGSCWRGGPPKGRFVANVCTASAEHAGSVQSTNFVS